MEGTLTIPMLLAAAGGDKIFGWIPALVWYSGIKIFAAVILVLVMVAYTVWVRRS